MEFEVPSVSMTDSGGCAELHVPCRSLLSRALGSRRSPHRSMVNSGVAISPHTIHQVVSYATALVGNPDCHLLHFAECR